VSRILLPSGIGKINFSNSIISYFMLIALLGIESYGIREGAKVRNNRKTLSKLASELFTISLISSCLSYLIFILTITITPKLFEYRDLLLVYSVTIIFSTIGFDWLYTALEEYGYITIRSIIFQGISLIFIFLFVKEEKDYLRYALFGVFGSVGTNVLNFIHSFKFISLKIAIPIDLKKHLKSIFTLFAMVLSIQIFTVLDISMLGFLSGDVAVGYYSAAIKLNKMVIMGITAGSIVLLPRLSFYVGQQESNKFIELIHKSLNFLICIALPGSIGLFLLSKPIILLFCGENYLPSIPIMQVMTPIVLLISIAHPIGTQLFMPLGKERLTLLSVICGALCNLIINFLFIPVFGALGAAIATLFTEFIITSIQVFLARKYLRFRNILINFLQCLISSMCLTFVVVLILFFTKNILFQIVFSVLIGIFVYAFMLKILRNELMCSALSSVNKKIKKGVINE
jgi:O-antigen/teichoic acid export membrane protein